MNHQFFLITISCAGGRDEQQDEQYSIGVMLTVQKFCLQFRLFATEAQSSQRKDN